MRSAQLAEILSLVENQGDRVVGCEICHLLRHNPRTLIGKGVAEEVAARARDQGATMLVIDADLSPSQTRNLEDTAGISICDREAVILNVFARHATTRRARIQVEAARLEYLRPRIAQALRRLAGGPDFGEDARAWDEWWLAREDARRGGAESSPPQGK